ncbi:YccV-like-domain-containing protein [Myriangium duriaei CBS 260.36]|uniref:YccV-like-domain-containing protein n=1 Tax=Myriangium duriaei CBS 260.36 TaxID=1168546 RepID=A0A9P4J4L5_9PEZI|nr:YccV-like-domain-containing protein [Myriangium duriaei CBS 260.36]
MASTLADESMISSAADNSLHRLPDEVIQSIIFHLSPHDAVRFGAACRRFNGLIDAPILWRHYCDVYFSYWKHNDDTDDRIIRRDPIAPWKQHFVERIRREERNRALFESALSTQHERYAKIQEIAECEYEAKDMLLIQCDAPSNSEDVLARRYFAEATLGLVHRTNALRSWHVLATGKETTLEEQLAAFDLFVIGKHWGNAEDITRALDDIADGIKNANPNIDELDDLQRSLVIIRHLRDNHLVGMDDGTEYHSMKNNYLSFNLLHQSHASLPLQSAVIFCSVARRLGIVAHPCNYPAHIYVVVMLNRNVSSEQSRTISEKDCLYLDPWTQDTPVALEHLVARLRVFGISEREFPMYLAPAPVRSMVLRTCRNIMHSYQDWRRGILQDEPPVYNYDAFYSYLWCMALVEDGNANEDGLGVWHRPHLAHLPPFFKENFPEDLPLVNRYLGPMFATHPNRQAFHLTMAEMKASDLNRRPVVRRDEKARHVKYKIGQMLQHRRYGYVGVIRRWDPNCQAAETWIAEMGVERLSKGRWQPFYDVLAEDRSQRYVAEENIEPIYAEPPPQLMRAAGKYFKRWDADSRVFVSNLRDEYPDD